MSAWKQFLTQDIIVEPFEVNKSFTFYGSQFIPAVYDNAFYDGDIYEGGMGELNNSIDRFLGSNCPTSSSFSYPTLRYDIIVYVTSSTQISGYDDFDPAPGKLFIEYTGSATGFAHAHRFKFNEVSKNGYNVSTQAGDWTELITYVGQNSPYPSPVVENFIFPSVAYSGDTFRVNTLVGPINSIYQPYSVNSKNVIPTPTFVYEEVFDLTIFNPEIAPKTGNDKNQYQSLIYSSIKELYYSNYLTASYGSPVQTQSLYPGQNTAGDVIVGNPDSSGRYYNYLESTYDINRYFPTGSCSKIAVLAIPGRLFGDYVQPGSFEYICVEGSKSYVYYDDSEGNILYEGAHVGNIIYAHGMAIFTNMEDDTIPVPQEGYGTSSYGNANIYGDGLTYQDIVNCTNVTCSFSSSLTIYETQYKATIAENEFNFSQNPSIISGSTEGTVYDFSTGSYFAPYVTTVGLYDEAQNLLAVGKLSQPLPTSRTTDTTIFINIDR